MIFGRYSSLKKYVLRPPVETECSRTTEGLE